MSLLKSSLFDVINYYCIANSATMHFTMYISSVMSEWVSLSDRSFYKMGIGFQTGLINSIYF